MAVNTTNPPFAGGVFRGSDLGGNVVWYDPAQKRNRWFNGTTELGLAQATGAPTASGVAATSAVPNKRKVLPITAGQYDDFMAAANATMKRLGIVAREPTDEEIVQFAHGGMDAEGIADYYSFLPEFQQQNPGLPYGVSSEQYQQTKAGYGEAYRSVFGQQMPEGARPRGKGDLESSLLGFGLRRGITQNQFAQTAETFRQERGRAPTVSEFSERFARPTQRFSQTEGGPAYSATETGTVARGLKGPSKGAARPAV